MQGAPLRVPRYFNFDETGATSIPYLNDGYEFKLRPPSVFDASAGDKLFEAIRPRSGFALPRVEMPYIYPPAQLQPTPPPVPEPAFTVRMEEPPLRRAKQRGSARPRSAQDGSLPLPLIGLSLFFGALPGFLLIAMVAAPGVAPPALPGLEVPTFALPTLIGG